MANHKSRHDHRLQKSSLQFTSLYLRMKEIDKYRKDLEIAMKCRRDDILLIGGDHKAQIGRLNNEESESAIGKWGLRNSIEAGTELVEWAQRNELFVVDSFFQERNRGTWCQP